MKGETTKEKLKELSKKEQHLKEKILREFGDGYSNKEIIRVLAYLINTLKKVK